MIRVYHFKLWDPRQREYIVPPYKSPADLVSHLGGIILTDTAETVEMSSLDAEQRYDPRSRSTRPRSESIAQGLAKWGVLGV